MCWICNNPSNHKLHIYIFSLWTDTFIKKTIKIADGGIPAKIKNVLKNTKKYVTQ